MRIGFTSLARLRPLPILISCPRRHERFFRECRYVTAAFHTVDRDRSAARNRSSSSTALRAVITRLFVPRIKTRRFTNCATTVRIEGESLDYLSNILDPGGQIEENINARIR